MKKLVILLTIAALVCLSFTAMAAGDGIAFDTSVDAINEGETLQTVLTREGDAAGGEVTYTSSNPKMATVDENGLVTALLKGRVVITAVVKGGNKSYKAQLKLSIIRPATSVTVNSDKLPVYAASDEMVASHLTVRENAEENDLPVLLLPVKKKLAITAAIEPKDASNRNAVFFSSDESIFAATKGNVTGIAPGEAILTIASESNPEVLTRFRVLVVQPVTKLSIESSETSVTVGGQIKVTAVISPENATMQDVVWSSGTEKLLTIDENGTVTGLKHGNGRILATAADGSGIRANINMKVIQNPESITFSSDEITIAVGRNAACKATVLPKDTDNKKVIWSSSDESIATVDKTGRITGISIGDCTVTCTSEALESVHAPLKVHIVQPVTKVSFNEKTALVYLGETTQLEWTIEPDNATNKTLEFKSAKDSIATVDAQGIITGVKSGKTTVTATATDGSKRKATITVRAGKHVTGVTMYRKHAYIDPGQSASTKAVIEPKDALNTNMTWESSNPKVVSVIGEKDSHVNLTGVKYGEAVVTGTTEDGGFQATIPVTVADFDHGIAFLDRVGWDEDGQFWLTVRNDTDFVITEITAVVSVYDNGEPDNPPVPVNTKDGSNKVNCVWHGQLKPGQSTGKKGWKMVNFSLAGVDAPYMNGKVTIASYQINGDWFKNIQTKNRQTKKYGNK